MQKVTIKTAALAALISLNAPATLYAELNTALPGDQEESFAIPLNLDMPAQPLAAALRQFAIQSNLSLTVDSALIVDKKAPAVKGRLTRKEAVKRLLEGSGLQGKIEGEKILIQRAIKEEKQQALQLEKVEIRAKRAYDIGPLKGLALTKEEIPGNVQSITAKEIKESKAVSLTDLMNSKLQSVNVNDYQSNPFQMDVTYRGFTASPQLGTSQGLSVFLDGIRVNEPFGDVVNWDMIPMNALNSLDVFPGSNPLFGLGTLGGAISMKTKSGFDSNEGTVEYLGGSFKRNQFQGSVGGNNGVIAGFAAANIFKEDGWRVNSPSEVNQLFAKGEWRNDSLQLGLSMLYAGNKLVGNGLLPTEMAKQDGSQIFTSPDETKNRLLQFQLNGTWDVSDTFNITGQVYRRKSRRNASTGDVNQNFGGSATRRPNPGEQLSNGVPDFDGDGLPDIDPANVIGISNVAALSVPDGNGGQLAAMLDINGEPEFFGFDSSGNLLLNPAFSGYDSSSPTGYDISKLVVGTNANTLAIAGQSVDANGNPVWTVSPENPTTAPAFNPEFYQYALNIWQRRGLADYGTGRTDGQFFNPQDFSYQYKDTSGFVVTGSSYSIFSVDPVTGQPYIRTFSGSNPGINKPLGLIVTDANGIPIERNGADCNGGTGLGTCAGYVDGTPTALITKTEIDQTTDGASLQLNWNLENHKFMVGTSIDAANASYESGQYLGLFDSKRRAYLDPSQVGYEFYASDHRIDLNDFAGNSTTKSVYFSETWTPKKEWAFTAAGRFNYTNIKNKLATNNTLGVLGPTAFKNYYQDTVLCPDTNGDGILELDECPAVSVLPFSPELALGQGVLGKGEIEKFTYRSFNPSLGATWQPTETLNFYGNWNKGARTPSVIELGCAFDATPVYDKDPTTGELIFVGPRSLAERRFCSLPSTLSGDPYLKQVRSETIEFGGRGYLTPAVHWNATAYQTDLTDDIYFVSFTADRSFFQNIGSTRRRGIELGLQGRADKWGFRLNYSLTDATFQDRFTMASPNNSSAGNVVERGTGYEQISVAPGSRIPGVPLHNLNATISYDITPDWTVSLIGILHSESFVRGNENNKHQVGAESIRYYCGNASSAPTVIEGIQYGNSTCQSSIQRPSFRYPGMVPGYGVWSFKTNYKLTKNLTAGLIVNNLFDREYYSAGRLGINPFSPSINGAIGPGGFNYNSNDWMASTFLAPGAPRSAFFTLTYDFDVGK
ncbi:TonB-dependent receptor domain-containing protein [Methylophilus sp. 5]|uniref:TonB-dependent receptor domain-containing protein n=1 Tax=Methylophilus sp. 5 TaxID=1112274 RepID=UPI0004916F63|nr:TonB-dependent receptor [Methylophilus sp. 5]